MTDLKEGPYRGLLLIKCDGCKEIFGYMAKEVTYSIACRECGIETLLEDLRIAYFKCSNCDQYYKYFTNIKDEDFTHICHRCFSPIDMKLNKKKMCYYPVGQEIALSSNKRRKK